MSERIRLLLMTTDLAGGGAEREFSVLAHHLPRDRFDIHLAFFRDTQVHPRPSDLPYNVLQKEKWWDTPRTILRLRRLIDSLQPEVMFTQLHFVNILAGTALADVRHRPAWACRFANDPARTMRGPFALWARRSVERANLVLGCSTGVTQALGDHLRVPEIRLRTLLNPVDFGRIESLSRENTETPEERDAFVFVTAARLAPQKNLGLLLHAFANLNNPDTRLWILGEGPQENPLKKEADRLGISEQVRWLGFQNNPYPYLRAADCFVLSSDYEGMPNVLVESYVCGTPAVSTDCPYGPNEIILRDRTGRLVPPAHAQALTDAMRRMVDQRENLPDMAAAGAAHVKATFPTRKVVSEYVECFTALALRENL